jgi:predicted amidophosphoribosyltransferase
MSSGGSQGKLEEKARHRGGASKKLVVLFLLVAAMAPFVGAVLNGGSNENAQTTADTTVTEQSRTVRLPLAMPAAPQNATHMIASKSVPFDSLRTDYSMAKYDFSRGPVTCRSGRTADPLTNGITVTGYLNGTGDSEMWYINVSSGATMMHTVLTCPSGANFDIYGANGYYPTTSSYYWRGVTNGSEDVTYGYPSSGTWYIMVNSIGGNGTYQLTVILTYVPTPQSLYSGSTVTGSLSEYGACDYYYIMVSSGATSMHSVLTCPSGANFDLYAKLGSYPTPSAYDWIGTGIGGQDLTYGYPGSGYWYIMVIAYGAGGTYSLTVTINYGGEVQVDSTAILAPMALILAGIFVFICVLVAGSRRNTLGSGRGSDYRPSQAPPMESGMEGEGRQEAAAVRMVQCKSCGASLKPGDNNCWNCGAPAKASLMASSVPSARAGGRIRSGICMVCKMALEKSEETLFCPYCGGLAHKDHMLEWLHVKDYCPTCGRHLDEAEVRKHTEPQSTWTNKKRRA